MAETGTAIGITITITAPFSSVASASHFLALDTLMDTATAGTTPTVAITPTLLTTGVATTVADIIAAVTPAGVITAQAAILVRLTLPTPTVQATATNQAWRAYSGNSLEPVIIEDPSMELWDLAPATLCVPTSTIMVLAPMG